MALKILHTTSAVASGGRNGHTRSADGIVDVELSVPADMGGPGHPGATTPEDLFAAGYAACFCGAAEFMSKQLKMSPKFIEVDAKVGIGAKDGGGFGLKVDLEATISGLSQDDANKLMKAADDICPYSNAIRNNVEVSLSVKVE